jgi:hypothetical protein
MHALWLQLLLTPPTVCAPCSSDGFSLNGTPLSPLKGSGVLVASDDPQCTVPGDGKLLVQEIKTPGKLCCCVGLSPRLRVNPRHEMATQLYERGTACNNK